jgi:hypothetical protein
MPPERHSRYPCVGAPGQLAALRGWNARLTRLRDRLEALPRRPLSPIPEAYRPVSAELAVPALGRPAAARFGSGWRRDAGGPGCPGLRLVRSRASFPPAAGAHIDVHLRTGSAPVLDRNGPDDTGAYLHWRQGGRRRGTRGSACLPMRCARATCSPSRRRREYFPLRRDALHTCFSSRASNGLTRSSPWRAAGAGEGALTFHASPARPRRCIRGGAAVSSRFAAACRLDPPPPGAPPRTARPGRWSISPARGEA